MFIYMKYLLLSFLIGILVNSANIIASKYNDIGYIKLFIYLVPITMLSTMLFNYYYSKGNIEQISYTSLFFMFSGISSIIAFTSQSIILHQQIKINEIIGGITVFIGIFIILFLKKY